ncbi:DMT family transporter [Amycolatopsis keratiniphila]|uniref:EamA family transporter n=1 Tax=Amycolatopsis keratiniphila subsp. keratiniphila TaxID=227715 RepID=A0A1W2LWR1_9PSEU|nr:EamA family transporter [Amycolatopsis keratiniphila]ONF70958.1 EamA family transporter [Amycolatopsis keratiniphila subsp. keratiniphila]
MSVQAPDRHRTAALRISGGAACTSVSAGFAKLSGASPGTTAFLRCAIALTVLVPLSVREWRRIGPRPWRLVRFDLAAGALLGIDYVFWVASIQDVGASISTVLLNIQVVVFPLLTWLFLGSAPSRRFLALAPVMLIGVTMAAGVIGQAEPGTDPVGGIVFGTIAGIAYAGYLFFMRQGSGQGHVVFPVCASTVAACAAAVVVGSVWTGIDLDLDLAAWLWLIALALVGQVLAWLLIAGALSQLAPQVSASLLLLHPVLAVVFGVFALHERPTVTQLGGCLLVVVSVWAVSRTPRRDRVSAAGA